jgi:hypothetical protein
MSGSIPPLPNMPSWRGAQLKHRDNFNFYMILNHFNAVKNLIPYFPEDPLYYHPGIFVFTIQEAVLYGVFRPNLTDLNPV